MPVYYDQNGNIPTCVNTYPSTNTGPCYGGTPYTYGVRQVESMVKRINTEKELDMCIDIINQRRNAIKYESYCQGPWTTQWI